MFLFKFHFNLLIGTLTIDFQLLVSFSVTWIHLEGVELGPVLAHLLEHLRCRSLLQCFDKAGWIINRAFLEAVQDILLLCFQCYLPRFISGEIVLSY